MLGKVQSSDFEACLDQSFEIRLPDESRRSLRLCSVDLLNQDAASADDDDRRQPFSLVFRMEGSQVLPQGTYSLEHPKLGVFALFLVPIGQDSEGVRYEAVFN